MGISGKDVQVWTWRVVTFSMRCAYSLIKNHPFVSCPVLFFLVLYICFPSFFWISLYSSIFLILAVSITKIYLRHRNAKSFRRDEKYSDAELIRNDAFAKNDVTKNGNEKSFMRARSVRRRKPREASRDSSVHTSEDEKNTIFSSTFNSDMVDKSALTEEKPKEIREIGVDSVISHAECSSSNVSSGLRPELHDTSYEGSRKFGGGGGYMEIESSEGTDEEDEQEREANNKAVQWTETDQKNLMDLGLSEIERNKRLESLIARRRARKMLSLQVRRSAVKMDSLENPGLITSLAIPRNNNSFLASQSTGNFSPMPGSAPSVLLPNYNPFDLPYDAQEEKPILTGGSFQLEFKDMTFIRNESVDSGASVSGELKEDQQETSLCHDSTKNEGVSEGLQNSKVKDQLDEKDTAKIIEVESCQSPESKLNTVTATVVIKEEVPDSRRETDLVRNCQENSSDIQTKSVLVEDSIDKLSSTSSSEDDVPIYRVDKDAVLRSLASPLLRNMSMNREGSRQMGYVNNYDPSVFDKNKLQEHLYHIDKALHHNNHTPRSSIASDLQVEVSEVSSPGLTDDGSNLFPDEEFSAYTEDLENESTTGEAIRETSFKLPRIDENESKEVYDTNDENTMGDSFSGTKESKNHVAHELEETVIEHDATDSFSQSASKAELPDRSEDHSSSFQSNIKDNFQLSTSSDSSHTLASDNLAFPIMDKVQQLKGDPVINVSQNDDSEKPKQPSYPSLGSTGELSTIDNVDDSKILQHNDEELNTRETDDIVDLLIEQGRREPTKLSETSSSNSIDYIGRQPEKIEEHHSISEVAGKDVNAKISEDIERELKDTKQDKADNSMTIENNDTPESIPVDEGEQHRVKLRSTGVHPHFSNHQVRALLSELILEQSHIASSASSPTSVLQPNISLDPSSLSSFGDEMHVEVHQFHPQRVENSMLDEARGEGLTCTLPQSTMLMMDSSSHPLNEESAKTLEESSNHSRYTKQANSTGSVREDLVHENESKQTETNHIPEGSLEGNESTSLSKCTEEANSTGSIREDMVHENESKQSETNYIPEGSSERQESTDLSKSIEEANFFGYVNQESIPNDERRENKRQESFNLSLSTEEDNSIGFVSEDIVNENERRQKKTNCIPEGSSRRQESSNPSASTWEDKTLNEDMFLENERRQNKTDCVLEDSSERRETSNLITSTQQDNSIGAESQNLIHENELRSNDMKAISEGSARKLSSPDPIAALSKLPKEINPTLSDVGQESSNILTSTREANYIGSVSKPVIHAEEKKHNETKDIPEVSSNSLSSYDSKATPSKPVEETNSYLPVLAPIEETSSKETVSEQVMPESEQRQNETKDISEGRLERLSLEPTVVLSKEIGEFSPDLSHRVQESLNLSASPEEANSTKFANECIIHENEKGQKEAKDIPFRSSLGLSGPDATVALAGKTGQTSSRSLTMTDDRSGELLNHKAENKTLTSLLNPIEQLNRLNTPIINKEEIYQSQGNPFGVTYKEEFLNSADGEPQASTNATTSKDTEGTVNGLQKLVVHKDHMGPSTLPETNNVSDEKYTSTSADEEKGGFSKPFEGVSKTLSPKEITRVEPFKLAEENNIQNSHILSPETEITTNAPAGRSIEEEVNGNLNTEKTVVSQMDGISEDETVKEAPKV